MENRQGLARYFWQVTAAHTIAYFVAGLFAMRFLDYAALWETGHFAFMRPLDSPAIGLGPGLQLFRGALYALVLLPLRRQLFEEKYGLAKFGLLLFGLTYLLTFAAAPGSFEGFIFTTIPLRYQLMGIPEMLLWIALFLVALHVQIKYGHKKIVTILSIFFVALIVLMSVAGFASLSGLAPFA